MTYQEFKQGAQMIAQGNPVFISERTYFNGRDGISFSIVYKDAENGDENGNGCVHTEIYEGENRYQDCLMDMKLKIFNLQKEPKNKNAWREENEAAA